MYRPNPVMTAIDIVLDWDLPDDLLPFTLYAHVSLLSAEDPEYIIGAYLR